MLQTPMSLSFPEQDFTPLLEKENKNFVKWFFQQFHCQLKYCLFHIFSGLHLLYHSLNAQNPTLKSDKPLFQSKY